jgi:succinyl-CoA synthetase beta subunit
MGDKINVPIICRLQGTNAAEAKELIDNSGMQIISATEFQEAADKVQEVLKS